MESQFSFGLYFSDMLIYFLFNPLVIYISQFEKCVFNFFTHLLIELFFVLFFFLFLFILELIPYKINILY